jgi:hypothetical protein
MKKIYMAVLLVLSTLSIAQAESLPEVKNDFSTDVMPASEKQVEYSLKVTRGNQIIFNSKFIIDNSVISPVFYMDEASLDEKEHDVAKAQSAQGSIEGKQAQEMQNQEMAQLRIAVHLDNKNKNMWSQFFWEDVAKSNSQQIMAGQLQGDGNQKNNEKALSINADPHNQKMQKEYILAHMNNEESTFFWQGYQFTVTAKIK